MFEGGEVLEIARRHVGERYVFGARADLRNPDYRGPWDCAEFCTWVVYQAYGVVFGTTSANDPFSGAWIDQARERDCEITLDEAVRTPGAILIRKPVHTGVGHVAFSDGEGGTVEARGTRYGVVEAGVFEPGRKWDLGCYILGVRYVTNAAGPTAPARVELITLTHPFTRGEYVKDIQRALRRRSFHPGGVDGVYGPMTAASVANYQLFKGLTPDAIVGPATAEVLGLDWPPPAGSAG